MARGCGAARTQGSAYLESRLSAGGIGLDFYMIDPAQMMEGIKVSSRGMKLMKFGNIWHLLDVVGKTHYPSPADYLEEVRAKGASRKISKKLDLSKLQPGRSRIITLHPSGMITNLDQMLESGLVDALEGSHWGVLQAEVSPGVGPGLKELICPKFKAKRAVNQMRAEHDRAGIGSFTDVDKLYFPPGEADATDHFHHEANCLGLHWMLWEPNDPDADWSSPRSVYRTVGDLDYLTYWHPAVKDLKPKFTRGVIASIPITNLVVVKADDGSHEQTMEKMQETSPWEVELVDS